MYVFFWFSRTVGMSPNLPSPGSASAALFPGGPSPSTLSALVSQHRLLELSRFGLRGYDLAQHMLTQQGAVSKLLGKRRLVVLGGTTRGRIPKNCTNTYTYRRSHPYVFCLRLNGKHRKPKNGQSNRTQRIRRFCGSAGTKQRRTDGRIL